MRTPQLDQLAGVLHQQQMVTRIEDVDDQGKVLFVEGDLTTDAHDEIAAVTQLDAPTATEVAAGAKEDN